MHTVYSVRMHSMRACHAVDADVPPHPPSKAGLRWRSVSVLIAAHHARHHHIFELNQTTTRHGCNRSLQHPGAGSRAKIPPLHAADLSHSTPGRASTLQPINETHSRPRSSQRHLSGGTGAGSASQPSAHTHTRCGHSDRPRGRWNTSGKNTLAVVALGR